MKLKDKIAIITGGSRGIGMEIALQFLEADAKVIICARDEERLKVVTADFRSKFKYIDYYAVNIANKTEVDKMFDEVIRNFGSVDILVNNAGITSDAQLYKMTEEQWDRVVDINLKGTFNCCSAAAKVMREKQYGKIINISSTSALFGNFGQVNYSAAKAGIIGMTKSIAKELGKYNINVNVIIPGVTLTEMTGKVPEKILNSWKERTPLNRFGLPADIANACLFLASNNASFITGSVLNVTGGFIL